MGVLPEPIGCPRVTPVSLGFLVVEGALKAKLVVTVFNVFRGIVWIVWIVRGPLNEPQFTHYWCLYRDDAALPGLVHNCRGDGSSCCARRATNVLVLPPDLHLLLWRM